jgi:hypothetical protein
MKIAWKGLATLSFPAALALFAAGPPRAGVLAEDAGPGSPVDREIQETAQRMVEEGRLTFRFDTFGDEAFWGDTLALHQALQGEKFGGVGPGVSPRTALAVGLKVDVDALPPDLVAKLQRGQVDLDSPATTLALLKLNSVIGVTGFFRPDGTLRSVGIQCACATRRWTTP